MSTHRRTLAVVLAAVLLPPVLGLPRAARAAPAPASTPQAHEISYYPRNHAWLRMWTEADQAKDEMYHHLDHIAGLGADTLRIFVPPAAPSASRVINGSFEGWNAAAGRFDNRWTADVGWSGANWAAHDCSVARSGQCSARLPRPGNLATGIYNTPALLVDSARPYTVSACVRVEWAANHLCSASE